MGYAMKYKKGKGFPFKTEGQGPIKPDEGPVENRVYVSRDNKAGDFVGEDEFEASFSQKKETHLRILN